MKKLNLLVVFAIVFATAFTSCSSDDGNRPTLQIMEPTKDAVFIAGDPIHVHAILKDDKQLSKFKIDIHYAGDGHTHGVVPRSAFVEWNYINEGNISGTEFTLDKMIEIPTTINESPIRKGEYHLGIFVLNSSGSETKSWVDIIIE